MLFLSATGLTWSQYAGDRFQALVVAVDGSTPELTAERVPAASRAPVSVQTVIDVARQAGLADRLKVTVPAEAGAVFTVAEVSNTWPIQRDQVAVSPTDGRITETILYQDWPVMAKLTRIGILAHMGSLLGLFSQLCLAAVALGLLAMVFWGYRMWWRRRPTRGGYAGALAPRGVARTLSQPVTFALVLGAVFVGWLIPLFGLSLLAFVLVDGAVGALARRRSTAAP